MSYLPYFSSIIDRTKNIKMDDYGEGKEERNLKISHLFYNHI